MPVYETAFTPQFLETFKKIDRHQQDKVIKRLERIAQAPELGKPLHAPLNHYKSERLESYRIIYRTHGNVVEFAWLDKRKKAYE